MAEKKDKDVVIIQETLSESIISDTYSMGSLFLVVLFAWWLDSTFISVFGASIWLLVAISKAYARSERLRKTPQEAADHLKREYGVTARE